MCCEFCRIIRQRHRLAILLSLLGFDVRLFGSFLRYGLTRHVAEEGQTLGRTVTQRNLHRVDKRVLEGNAVAVDDDHPLELWVASGIGLQVDRFDVHVRIADRDEQEVASDHLRALLAQERELSGHSNVLVDSVLNLFRTVDVLVRREAERE